MNTRHFPFLVILLTLLTGSQTDAQTQFRWVDALPGYSTASVNSASMAGALYVNRKGEVYVLASCATCDVDPGPGVDSFYNTSGTGGGFLGKYDSSGHFLWAHWIGPGGGTAITSDDSGNYYIVGLAAPTDSFGLGYSMDTSMVSGFFIAKYDSFDHLKWVKATPAPGGDLYSVKVDPSGSIFVCGQFHGSMDFDVAHPGTAYLTSSVQDGFVGKYSNNGDFVWVRQIHALDGDRAVGLDLDPSGNVLVTGYTGGFGSPTAPFGDTGGVYRYLTLRGGYDAFVAKYNTDGAVLWLRTLGGPGNDYGKSILVDGQGNVYAAGYYEYWMIADSATHDTLSVGGNTSAFLVKLDPSGNFIRGTNYGCDTGFNHYAIPFSLAKDDTDNVYMAAAFQRSVVLDPGGLPLAGLGTMLNPIGFMEYYILKLDSAGNYKWHIHTYSMKDDVPAYVGLDKDNNVYVSGYVSDTSDFDLTGPGGLVSFPLPNPNWTPVATFAKYAQPKPAGIHDAAERVFHIYPNPASNELTIIGSLSATASIEVFDALGRVCPVSVMISSGKAVIATRTLAAGMYILEYREAGMKPFREKFVRE